MTEHPIARRRLLGGAAALPAVVSLASPARASATHPDADLLDLGRGHAEADRLYIAACEAAMAAQDRATMAHPPKPEALRRRNDDWTLSSRPPAIGDFYDANGVGAMKAAIERAGNPAAWNGHIDALEAVNVAYGVRRLEAEMDALAGGGSLCPRQQILATPATTPDGWRVKARIAAHITGDEPDGTYEDHLVRNLLADLLREPGDRTPPVRAG